MPAIQFNTFSRSNETVLFLDGNPVNYRITRIASVFLMHPTGLYLDSIPVLSAAFENGSWQVEGSSDPDLIAQVIEDLTQYREQTIPAFI